MLSRLVKGAHSSGANAVVMTFHPHPAVVLGGVQDFKCLTTLKERIELLEGLGIDVVITQEFTRSLANQTAEDFMGVVVSRLGLRHLMVGYDFALGHNREGNATRLTEIGRKLKYDVEVVDPIRGNDLILSSTNIRSELKVGQVSRAAAALGRWYSVSGQVVKGDGRGKGIGFPTANVNFPIEKLIPASGIYASWSWVDGRRYPSATNIGVNPTFTPEKTTPNLETHLIGFDQDLYGQDVKVEFVSRLRDEIKFQSIEELVSQIKMDVKKCEEILSRS